MNDLELPSLALQKLQQKFSFTAHYLPAEGGKEVFDGHLHWEQNGLKITFGVICKREIRPAIVGRLEVPEAFPLLVIGERIFPQAKEALQQRGISYLEANGNACIQAAGLFVFVTGERPLKTGAANTNKAFTKTGLKVLFALLSNPEVVSMPYREIAVQTGVSLGAVNNAMKGLKIAGYLLEDRRGKWQLHQGNKLLLKWTDAYVHRLKPTLEKGTFGFPKSKNLQDWKAIEFSAGKTVWGGEPAGNLLTQHLYPEILTLYTEETSAALMLQHRLLPEENGPVEVYKKFWHHPSETNTAPPVLVYADLIATGDARCIETADLLYETHLKNLLD